MVHTHTPQSKCGVNKQTMKRQALKKLHKGEEMPYDFWNYLVNPITGYYVEPKEKYNKKNQYKYHKTSQSI